MTGKLVAALVLTSGLAMAQEIGTEIPAPPPATNPPSYDRPYGPAPAAENTAPDSRPAQSGPADAPAGARVPGPTRGAFGLRASFGGGGIPTFSANGPAVPAPSIGFKYFVTDSLGLVVDLGLGLGLVNGNMGFGFSTGLGADFLLGSASKPIRPFITAGASFAKGISTQGDDFSLGFQVGGGGEYWLGDHFSVNARALVGVPIDLKSGALQTVTFTPGIGGTLYF